MSLTLGEKLRQAREARGITIREIADQTRISAAYLESIENNDYRNLPGGIFNKGFVKSYARYVGIDEKEAIADYTQLLSEEGNNVDEPPAYRPEVLTNDRSTSPLLLTIVFAFVILGLLAGGVFLLIHYLQGNQILTASNSMNAVNSASSNASVNSNAAANAGANRESLTGDIKVEFKAASAPIWLASSADDKKAGAIVTPDKPASFTLKENLKLSYAKDLAHNAQLTINGKSIALPTAPAGEKRNTIDIEITRDNVGQIYQTGAVNVSSATTAAPSANRSVNSLRP